MTTLRAGTWSAERLPNKSQAHEAFGMVPEDELVGYYLASYLSQSAPFDQTLDSSAHVQVLNRKIELTREKLGTERCQTFDLLPHQAQMDDLVDSLGRIWLDRGDIKQAEELFNKSIRRRPWMPNGFIYAAVCRYKSGDMPGAQHLIDQSYRTVMTPTERVRSDRSVLERLVRMGRVM
jgi:hypothetical protein